jgi:hypothetical protein
MKKTKSPIYIRYEFSDETGCPEGADVLEVGSMKKIQELTAEILKVAHSDGVAVSLTVGENKPFFTYLENSGVCMAEFCEEAPKKKTATKKKSAKKK